jgi:hypothetical protein
MSIERNGSDIHFVCDVCDAFSQDFEASDFTSSWNGLKIEGWRAFKEDNEWQHRCPKCVGK